MTSISNPIFLIHITPPIGYGAEPTLVYLKDGVIYYENSVMSIDSLQRPIVTHSFSTLIEWFVHQNVDNIPFVLDLELAYKLISGKPKKAFSGLRPWDIWSLFKDRVSIGSETEKVENLLRFQLGHFDSTNTNNVWIESLVHEMPGIWSETLSSLQQAGEWDRYVSVEVPIYNYFLKMQRKGIRIDFEKFDELSREISKSLEKIKYVLSINHKVNISRALQDVEYLREVIGDSSIYSESESLYNLLLNYEGDNNIGLQLQQFLKTKRTIGIFQGINYDDKGFCYPAYDTLGPVTGRILLPDTQFQYLPKKFRTIIGSRKNHKFYYIDFAQYEPSILASISQNPFLIKSCNEGSLYRSIAHHIFKDSNHLDDAKVFIMKYINGMSQETLIDQYKGIIKSTDAVIDFFTNTLDLSAWRDSLVKKFEETGKVGTLMGNFRHSTQTDGIVFDDNHWVVSQLIQGTGSLILKEVILMISLRLRNADILLPMHDALLIEVPFSSGECTKRALIDCFTIPFEKYCPNVRCEPVFKFFTPVDGQDEDDTFYF